MKSEVERLGMDLNQQIEFDPSSTSPLLAANLMPMSSFMLENRPQKTREDYEQDKRSHFELLQKQNMEIFWNNQMMNIHSTAEFKGQHGLPLSRIKRIMKSDEEVKMVSADTLILFSQACELFILELTLRGWLQTEASGRGTIQRCDIAKAVSQYETLDFLLDLVPCEHEDEETTGKNNGGFETLTGMPFHLPTTSGNHMVPQPFMIEPPVPLPSAGFNYETAPR